MPQPCASARSCHTFLRRERSEYRNRCSQPSPWISARPPNPDSFLNQPCSPQKQFLVLSSVREVLFQKWQNRPELLLSQTPFFTQNSKLKTPTILQQLGMNLKKIISILHIPRFRFFYQRVDTLSNPATSSDLRVPGHHRGRAWSGQGRKRRTRRDGDDEIRKRSACLRAGLLSHQCAVHSSLLIVSILTCPQERTFDIQRLLRTLRVKNGFEGVGLHCISGREHGETKRLLLASGGDLDGRHRHRLLQPLRK